MIDDWTSPNSKRLWDLKDKLAKTGLEQPIAPRRMAHSKYMLDTNYSTSWIGFSPGHTCWEFLFYVFSFLLSPSLASHVYPSVTCYPDDLFKLIIRTFSPSRGLHWSRGCCVPVTTRAAWLLPNLVQGKAHGQIASGIYRESRHTPVPPKVRWGRDVPYAHRRPRQEPGTLK